NDKQWVVDTIKDDGTYKLYQPYGWGESLVHASEYGGVGAAGMIAAPYAGKVLSGAWESKVWGRDVGIKPWVVDNAVAFGNWNRRFLGASAAGETSMIGRGVYGFVGGDVIGM